MFRYLAQIYSIIIIIIGFFIILFPISLIAALLPRHELRLKTTAPFWISFFRFIMKFVTFTKIYKEDHRPKEDRVFTPTGLYICNHKSYMDIPLTLSEFAIPPIMKKVLLYIPFFGVAAYSSGALTVNRQNRKSRVQTFHMATSRLLGPEGRLQYYPEGTRQRGNLAPKSQEKIKDKIIRFAYQNNIKVYPMSVRGTEKILSRKGVISYGEKVGLILHAPLSPQDFNSEDEFVKKSWEIVCAGYEKLEEKLI